MRFDTAVEFWEEDKKYNPATHEYGADRLIEKVFCNVTDVGTNRTKELFGSYNQNVKVVRIAGQRAPIFDYLMIDKKKYELKTSRFPLKTSVLLVGEVK
ncbi:MULTISPECIES: hypothetical protein [Listeria]|uniref:hypothetical protein n=1 Tax=Listeria TaxID=1637 RepID=UPI000B593ECA|nr:MULTISPECIES: hypothetical protein [Listeria]